MSTEQGPLSGFRDMLAGQMIPRQAMLDTIQKVYEGYGFTPLGTPAIERYATLTGKYGEEGDKLMYKFEDNGGRMVALRYDMTVPLARVVAQYGSQLPTPYKRYVVGQVWRGESPQAGRYREFTQFDADIVGNGGPVADAEIVAMMSDAMTALGAESLIRVNDRRILTGLVQKAGLEAGDGIKLIATIDKIDKIGQNRVLEVVAKEFGQSVADLTGQYLSATGTPIEKLRRVTDLLDNEPARAGADNLNAVFNMLGAAGYSLEKAVFDQTIARGLDYYTGIIFETTLVGAEPLGSVCSGGRYDKLVAALGGPDTPAIGTSIGVDRLYDGLQQLDKLRQVKTNTQVLIVNFDSDRVPDYLKLATELRQANVPTEVYYESTKLGKQLSYANRLDIPFVVLVGPQELEKGVAVIKTLLSGDQLEVPLADLPTAINGLRTAK